MLSRQQYEGLLADFIKQRAIAAENLTADQIASALRQALECGDFTRHVRVDNQAQSVTYIPYREVEKLRGRILELEGLLRQNSIPFEGMEVLL